MSSHPRRFFFQRTPVVPVFLLLAFTALVGYFVAERHIAAAEAQRLRLLAGFGDRVRDLVPNLVERMVRITQESQDSGENLAGIAKDLEGVQNLKGDQNLEAPRVFSPPEDCSEKGEATGNGSAGRLEITPSASRIDLSYVRCEGGPEAKPKEESDPLDQVQVAAHIDLKALLQPFIIPEIFDAMVIATEEGAVLFRAGDPEVQLTDIRPLFTQAEEEAEEKSKPPLEFGAASTRVERQIGGVTYRIFLQPFHLDFEHRGADVVHGKGLQAQGNQRWMACGLVRYDRLLSASLTTSPVMLLILMSIFPLGLVSWPFLKNWLISPRQRFVKSDLVGLVVATFLGSALLTLLLFDLIFLFHLEAEFDQQLESLAEATEKGFFAEITAAYDQMKALARKSASGEPWTNQRVATDRKLSSNTKHSWIESPEDLAEFLSDESNRKLISTYPLFQTASLIEDTGQQSSKLPLNVAQRLPIVVKSREYFQCAKQRAYFTLPRRSIHPGGERGKAKDSHPEKKAPIELCIQSIISSTAGGNQAALAARTCDLAESCNSSAPVATSPPVLAMTTRLTSIAHATLPSGFGLAVLDTNGRVMFHSDGRRNLTENFLEASGGNSELEALLQHRRAGNLTLSYWGQRHRAFIQPLDGLPWALITFRGTQEMRGRNLEVFYDFLNPFLVYTLVLVLLVMGLLKWRGRRFLRSLWPDPRRLPAYRFMVSAAPPVAVLAAWAVHAGRPWIMIFVVLAVIVVIGATLMLKPHTGDGESPERFPRDSVWRSRLPVVVSIISALAVVPILLPSPTWTAVLLLVFILGVAWAWWQWKRYFTRKQSRYAYHFALANGIFLLAVLPALLFARTATERQLQFLVQDTQVGLARAVENRGKDLQGLNLRRDGETGEGVAGENRSDDLIWPGLKRMEQEHLKAIYDTRRLEEAEPPREQEQEPVGNQGFLWPYGSRRFAATPVVEEERGTNGGKAEPTRLDAVVSELFSTRLVPAALLSRETVGVDLSRFEAPRGTWWIEAPIGIEGGQGNDRSTKRIRGQIPQKHGAGEHLTLTSALVGADRFVKVPISKHLMLVFGTVLLVATPWLLAWVLLNRVFLAALVGDVEPQTLEDLKAKVRVRDAQKSDERLRILLVTGVPELSDPEWDVHDFRDFMDAQEKTRMSSWKSAKCLVLTQFRPLTKDEERGHKDLVKLQKLVQDHRRSFILVSRMDPRAGLIERANGGHETGESAASRTLERRWAAFLGSFVVHYAVDSGDSESFTNAITARKGENSTQRSYFFSQDDIAQRLEIVESECKHTHQLQKIGLEMLDEIENPAFKTLSSDRIIARIGILARAYYVGIWEACTENEKIALAQLAKDGLVNPQRFESVLDLMQKGLVTRKPNLRIMNRSFSHFVRDVVRQTDFLAWEEESGPSAWDVVKWVLPVPILLLGAFLFYTQRDAFSNATGLILAFASVAPTLINLFQYFQEVTLVAANRERTEA